MIDFESQIFTAVSTAITTSVPTATVRSIDSLTSAEMPFVSIVEIGNAVLSATQDSISNERHATISYEINVYTDSNTGRKQQAKFIAAIADNKMLELGFTRISKQPISLDEATRYRLVMRYTAIIDANGCIYRR